MTIKFGFDFHRTTVQQYFDKYFRGRLKFEGHTATNGNVPVDTAALTDFLAGYVDSGFQYFGDSTRHTYENNFGFYVQDSYRLTPRLDVELRAALGLLRGHGREEQPAEQHH